MKIKKGDKVKVLSGKDKGKTGTITMVLRKINKVVVDGINMVTKFEKRQGETKKGGISRIEAPMQISKLQVLDEAGKPTRVGFKFEKDKKVRIAKKTQKLL